MENKHFGYETQDSRIEGKNVNLTNLELKLGIKSRYILFCPYWLLILFFIVELHLEETLLVPLEKCKDHSSINKLGNF